MSQIFSKIHFAGLWSPCHVLTPINKFSFRILPWRVLTLGRFIKHKTVRRTFSPKRKELSFTETYWFYAGPEEIVEGTGVLGLLSIRKFIRARKTERWLNLAAPLDRESKVSDENWRNDSPSLRAIATRGEKERKGGWNDGILSESPRASSAAGAEGLEGVKKCNRMVTVHTRTPGRKDKRRRLEDGLTFETRRTVILHRDKKTRSSWIELNLLSSRGTLLNSIPHGFV